jgi:hypothetical protein
MNRIRKNNRILARREGRIADAAAGKEKYFYPASRSREILPAKRILFIFMIW